MSVLSIRCNELGIAVKDSYSAKEVMFITGQSQVWTYRQLKQGKLEGARQDKDGVWTIPATTVENKLQGIIDKRQAAADRFADPATALKASRQSQKISEMSDQAIANKILRLQEELNNRAAVDQEQLA